MESKGKEIVMKGNLEKGTGKGKGFILTGNTKKRKGKIIHNEQQPEDRGREKTRKGIYHERKS